MNTEQRIREWADLAALADSDDLNAAVADRIKRVGRTEPIDYPALAILLRLRNEADPNRAGVPSTTMDSLTMAHLGVALENGGEILCDGSDDLDEYLADLSDAASLYVSSRPGFEAYRDLSAAHAA